MVGGLVSGERIRLPAIMDGVLLILISIISCASLGCFLRKDLLEGSGAVLDFHGKKVQWKMLAPQRWDETFKNESWAFFDEPTTTTS